MPRTVPITKRLRAQLLQRRNDPSGQPLPLEPFVLGNEVGEAAKSIRTAWENTLERAQIKDLHFHDLRRENGSRLLEKGATLIEVRDHLGHTNVLTTDRYLTASLKGRRRLGMLLDGFAEPVETSTDQTAVPAVGETVVLH